jgi:uncharacterized membrane protein YqhA
MARAYVVVAMSTRPCQTVERHHDDQRDNDGWRADHPLDAESDGPLERSASVPRRRRSVQTPEHLTPAAPLAELIGKTRFIVLVAVVSVILVSVTLFVIGAGLAVQGSWHAVRSMLQGNLAATPTTVDLLEVVSVMLKAVVFYLVGVGFYSLFIAPLNLTAALGIRSFNDLEIKVVSVVVVIMAVTFLEHFIRWDQAVETLLYGVSLAVVVGALVLFQMHSHRAARDDEHENARSRFEAQRELFHEDHEEREVRADHELADSGDVPP